MSDWKWKLRPAAPDDIPFIYATWLNSYWSDSQSSRGVRKTTYFAEYPKIIDKILTGASTKTLVACHFEEPGVVFGYAVATPPVAHYVFVKSTFHNYGIAKSLLKELKSGETYTHRTGWIGPIMKKHPELCFNPYLIYEKGEENGKESIG